MTARLIRDNLTIAVIPMYNPDGAEANIRQSTTPNRIDLNRDWENFAQPESVAFVAEEDGRPVGFVVGFYEGPHFMWDTGRVGHIDSFYVLPEMRGRGVGRTLMDAAYTEMQQAGATTVALEMVSLNDVARRFYEREGFTTTFVQMHRRLVPPEDA